MLGKLIKHEFIATQRLFLPIYLIVFVLTLAARIFNQNFIPSNGPLAILSFLVTFLYIVSLISLGVVALFVIVSRFYKNTVGEEGYLMHTLPITKHQFILSKAIVSFVWSICSGLIGIISLFIFCVTPENLKSLLHIPEMITTFEETCGVNFYGYFGLILVMLILSLIQNILFFYASISFGQSLSNNKLLGSICGGIIIYIVTQIISSVSILLIPTSSLSSRIVASNELVWIKESMHFTATYLFPFACILSFLLSVILYYVCIYFLSKKLNLE